MTAPELKVFTLFKSNYRDPVAALRVIADDIEAGKYGDVGTIGVVLLGDTMEVFGMGVDSTGPSVALLLNAGVLRLTRELEEYGRE
jgi:hypothetical protein